MRRGKLTCPVADLGIIPSLTPCIIPPTCATTKKPVLKPIPKTPIANKVYDAVLRFYSLPTSSHPHPQVPVYPTHTHAYLLAARIRVTTYLIIRNLLAMTIILQFRDKLLPSWQQMRLPRFAWRTTERPAALGPRGAKVASVLVACYLQRVCGLLFFLIVWGMVRCATVWVLRLHDVFSESSSGLCDETTK